MKVRKSHRDGYLGTRMVAASGGQITVFVHALMAQAFLGPKPDSPGIMVRHLDGNLLNNVIENLAWGTRSQNTYDSVRHGTHNHARKTHCAHGHPFSGHNLIIKKDGKRRCRECHRRQQAPINARNKARSTRAM